MPTVNLGRIGFVNKGNYIGLTTSYKINDIVKYTNSVYVCIQAHSIEHLPTDVLYWQVWIDTANYYVKSEVDSLLLTEIGTPIASASTTAIGGVGAGDVIHITGVTTITSFGASVTGTVRTLIFDSAITLTHNGTSMILPNSANMLIAAGSSIEVICEDGALGYWRCTKVMHNDVSMAELGYISTLTSDAQTQINTKVQKDSDTGSMASPAGTTAQRSPTPQIGWERWNTELNKKEIWNGTVWTGIGGGATGGGADTVFVETSFAITQNYTLTAGKSAMTVGDASGNVTIANGVTVTIPDGSKWEIL